MFALTQAHANAHHTTSQRTPACLWGVPREDPQIYLLLGLLLYMVLWCAATVSARPSGGGDGGDGGGGGGGVRRAAPSAALSQFVAREDDSVEHVTTPSGTNLAEKNV